MLGTAHRTAYRTDARRLAAVLTLAFLAAPVAAAAQQGVQPQNAPPPDAWLESGPQLAPGQPARLGYRLPRSGYLAILRASTDGEVSVVYPRQPNDRSSRGLGGALPLRADRAPGVGYLFWVTSPAPFDFRQYTQRGGRWSSGGLARRGGDPFEAVDRFARTTTRGRYSVGYSGYRVGAGRAVERGAPAVHGGGYGGYDAGAYGAGVYGSGAYGGGGYGPPGYAGYGSADAGWWGGPQWNGYSRDTWRYRRSWRDREYRRAYDRAAYSDPRSRYLRHCADGTLAPYTVPCGEATQRGPR